MKFAVKKYFCFTNYGIINVPFSGSVVVDEIALVKVRLLMNVVALVVRN